MALAYYFKKKHDHFVKLIRKKGKSKKTIKQTTKKRQQKQVTKVFFFLEKYIKISAIITL